MECPLDLKKSKKDCLISAEVIRAQTNVCAGKFKVLLLAPTSLGSWRGVSGRIKPSCMILEVAILDIGKGTCEDFETAFREASPIIASIPGYVSHELRRCLEKSNRYILLVKWQTLESHTVGFRQSAEYQRWRALLHHFYDPFPLVEHYDSPLSASSS
jgi:heme-degrading monooxygenase HmoA